MNIEKISEYLNVRQSLLTRAFDCLDDDHDGRIDLYTWNELMQSVRPDLNKDQATILFAMVDDNHKGFTFFLFFFFWFFPLITKNHKGYIQESEFMEICSFLDLTVKKNQLYNERVIFFDSFFWLFS